MEYNRTARSQHGHSKEKDVDFFKDVRPKIRVKLSSDLLKFARSFKCMINLRIKLYKDSDDGTVYAEPSFHSGSYKTLQRGPSALELLAELENADEIKIERNESALSDSFAKI